MEKDCHIEGYTYVESISSILCTAGNIIQSVQQRLVALYLFPEVSIDSRLPPDLVLAVIDIRATECGCWLSSAFARFYLLCFYREFLFISIEHMHLLI